METLTVFGIPIPPSKVAEMTNWIEKKNSVEYQELTWNSLRTVIEELVKRVDPSNLKDVVAELFAENIIRGKGMFCDSCTKYQTIYPEKTIVYAALVAAVDSRFPAVGNLLTRRLFMQFNLLFERYDKELMLAVTKFIVHLINFRVMDYCIAIYIMSWCLEKGNSEYVECAVELFKELNLPKEKFSNVDGMFRGVRKQFRKIVRGEQLDQDVLDGVKDLLDNWDSKFERHPSVCPALDWVKEEREWTHSLHPKYKITVSIFQDNFKPDALFLECEIAYETFKRHVLLEGYWKPNVWKNSHHEWRKYLTVFSWTDDYPERVGNQLLQQIEPGEEMQLCLVLLEECIIGDLVPKHIPLAEYLCKNNKLFQLSLAKCFLLIWLMIPGLDSGLECVAAEFFAELLVKDLLSWHVLAYVQVTPPNTADQSYFLRNLFMILALRLTEGGLLERLLDPSLQNVVRVLFPVDDPVNARFALKFFKEMGLNKVVKGIKKSRIPLA